MCFLRVYACVCRFEQPHSEVCLLPLNILTSAELDEVLRDAADGYLCLVTTAFDVVPSESTVRVKKSHNLSSFTNVIGKN